MTQFARGFFAIILLAAFATQPLAAARIVHFPAADPVGTLMISPPVPPGETPSARFEPANFGWPGLGAAQGDVTVPDGRQLVLIVHPRRRPLSLLARLGPNDLDQICVITTQNEPLNFNTQVLPYIRHLSGLKGLYLYCVNLDTAGVRGLASFPALRYLYLTSMDPHPRMLGDSDLALLRRFKSLEILRLSSERITDAGMAYLGEIKSLRELSINTTNIKGPGFAELAKLPAFEECIPGGDANFDDRKLAYVKPLTNVKRLSLGNKITDAGLATIATMKNLEGVDLHWNDRITDAGIARLAALPALKSLDVSHARLTPKGAAILGKIQTLEQLKLPYLNDEMAADLRTLRNLKYLYVGNGGVTDAGLNQLASLSNLEDVLIGGKIGDAGMASLARLTKLKKLFITSAPNLTNQGLASLGTIKSLTELHLPYSYGKNPKVTIGGLSQLNALTSLRLLEARNIKQDGAGLNLSALTGLEELTIWMTRDSQLTDRDLAGLANLRKVEKLDLGGSLQKEDVGSNIISDAGLAHFSNLVSLNQLTVSGGPQLTDAGLASLAGLKRLTSLEIRGNFTDGALSRIGTMESARGLCHLDITGDFTSNGLKALEPMKMLNQLELKTGRPLDPASLKRLQASLPMMFTFNVEGNRALPTPNISGKLLKPSAALSETRPAGRVVHFPKDRSLGTVSVLDENYVEKIEPYFYSPNFIQWEKLGRAQGDVVIPPGKKVKLMLGRDAARDLSPLAMLGPNDLDALEWGGCMVEPSDQAIAHITRLTGLKELNIAAGMLRTNGTDPCPLSMASMAKLRAMPSLVSLKPPYHMTNEQFAALSGMTRLKRLDLQSNRFTDRGLAPLATMTGLEQLAVGGERLTDPGLYYIAGLPRLTHLRLWGRGFHDGALAHIKNIRTLKSLSIFWHQITDAGFAQLSSMTQLEQLHAGYTKITNAGLAHLKPLRNLKTLGLGDTMINDDGLVHLKDMTSLEVLGLNGGSQNYGKGVTGRGLPHLANLKNLRSLTLNLPRTTPLTDAEIKNLIGFSRLEELELWGTCMITDQGMADLAKISNLKTLDLGMDAPRITNHGLAQLAKLSRLERLKLGGANGITISGLNALGGLTNLKVLNAGYCFKWKIEGDKPLDISGLKNLEELSLTSARDEDLACLAGLTKLSDLSIPFWERLSPGNTISDRGLRHLAGLTSMKKLSIGGPGVTDAGLSNLARMNNLEYLSLQGYFTSAGLQQLQHFKNLWSINIKSGSSLSPSAIQHLRASLPEITYFEVAGDKKLPKVKTMPTSSNSATLEPAPATTGNRHPQVGQLAPQFTATTLDGKQFSLADQRGKVVVLHFWATWCAPCIKSAPSLKKLQDQLKERFGDRFVWVDLSLDDYERNVVEHVKKHDIKSVQIRLGGLSRIAADYGVNGGVPDDFMIGPDGKVLLNRETPQVDTATAIANALK